MQFRQLSKGLKASYSGTAVHSRVKHFDEWMDRAHVEDANPAGYDHTETVKEYYDLCGEFMVFGWGESLHFAPLSPRESLEDSKVRHQRLMIAKLELRKGMTVIDVGCGIGGPMRTVIREAGVRVVGVNSNEIQLKKAKSLNAEAGLDSMVDYLACSFMDMGAIADDTFDRGYAIESTCHAPDKAGAFAEIYRVLKPGALFWGQEMCMTDKFDPDDKRHRAIKKDLMRGIALKDIATMGEVNRALETAGFQVIEAKDRAVEEKRSDHAVVSAHGNPGQAAGHRPAQDSAGPQGIHRDIQPPRGGGDVPEGIREGRRIAGSYRQRLCRRWQGRHIHAVVLFPGSQTPLGSLHPCHSGVPRVR